MTEKIQGEILELLAEHHPNPLTGLSAHLNGYTQNHSWSLIRFT